MSVRARGHEPPLPLLCDGSHGLTEVIMCTILGPNCFSTQFRSKIIVCQTQERNTNIQFSRNIVHNTRVDKIFCTQFKGNIVCPRKVDTQSKFVGMSLTNYSVNNFEVTLCVNTRVDDSSTPIHTI